jgi:squalene synthase HpnC
MDDDVSALKPASPDLSVILHGIASRTAQQMRSENFPVAMRLIPRKPRGQLARVYAFARFVDDVGDTAPGDRLELLDLIDADVRALWAGGATLPPVAGLRPVVDGCAVPIDPFLDLIEANRLDQTTARYETFDDLLGYCRLSAAPIGRIVLHIAGMAGTDNVVDSDSVCAALQVLEHCQDVGEDARAGRIYLPAADLHAAGVTDEDLLATTTPARLRHVIAMQVGRSSSLLGPGHKLVRRLSGWPRMAVSGYVAGGLATASALQAADYNVLESHVGPSTTRTAMHAARLILGRRN